MEHPETQQYEFRIKDRQGQIRDVIYGKGVFLDADGAVAGIVGTFFDVTDRNEAERQLSEYRRHLEELVDRRTRELKRAYEELRQFAFAAAHDLQEPLRQIVIYTQMLQKQLGPAPDAERRQAIDYAVAAAKLMRTRIGDIKSFLDEMETARARQEVDIEALVKAVVEEFAETARKRNANLVISSLPRVVADREGLVHVFRHLVGNALKFHDPDNPPDVAISALRGTGEWVFSVADNGIGIAPEYRERVFGIFKRLHTQEAFPGTGMGLAITKKIVERHGGRIWVENNPGRGSRFLFTLPDEANLSEVG